MKLLLGVDFLKIDPPVGVLKVKPALSISDHFTLQISCGDDEIEYVCTRTDAVNLRVEGVRFDPDQWRPLHGAAEFPTDPVPATIKFSTSGWGVWLQFPNTKWLIKL